MPVVFAHRGSGFTSYRYTTIGTASKFTPAFMQHISPKNSVFVSQQFGRKHGQSDNIL